MCPPVREWWAVKRVDAELEGQVVIRNEFLEVDVSIEPSPVRVVESLKPKRIFNI